MSFHVFKKKYSASPGQPIFRLQLFKENARLFQQCLGNVNGKMILIFFLNSLQFQNVMKNAKTKNFIKNLIAFLIYLSNDAKIIKIYDTKIIKIYLGQKKKNMLVSGNVSKFFWVGRSENFFILFIFFFKF